MFTGTEKKDLSTLACLCALETGTKVCSSVVEEEGGGVKRRNLFSL